MFKITLVALAVTPIMFVAACGGTESTPKAAAKPAARVTVTVTPEPKTVTKTVTKNVPTVPQSCLEAIADTRRLAGNISKYVDTSGDYVQLLPKALNAGIDQSPAEINAVAAKMRSFNGKQSATVGKMRPIVADFRKHSDACESAAN